MCMSMHVYVYVCVCGGICGHGWHMFDGNLWREVHEWPVLPMSDCLYITVLGVMLLGSFQFSETTGVSGGESTGGSG